MQWRRQKKITHVIGSSNHVLLLARYQDAPPGEEDEEEGLRKEYVKSQDKEANAHTVDRNGQSGYKPWRFGTGTSGSTSGYASSGSRSHRDESSGSPSQPKVIFNEDEYTRITTPRQDVLFKKGYLSRKKPWAGNASTSATPSTTESQSASHSTADGSETTEDQQLLDRDSGTGEYPPMVEPGAQLGYGTFYDHASGYYYEYPVMLVGPAPVPAQVGPSVLAAVPCGPVPLRPIEWINPAFVPKLANQPYCLMDYQTSQSTETATIVEEHNGTVITEAPNGMWNESGTGSASCSGSVAEEIEEQAEEMDSATATEQRPKEQYAEEQQHFEQQPHHQHHEHLEGQQQQQHLENGSVTTAMEPYLDPLMLQEPPPIHVSHVVPTVPQPYMYPGHYMFGPPLVNVNGVTIQGGPLVRTMDIAAMTMACAKRRKKRKKRKQKRPTLGNTEDEEEGEYSSECDNDLSSSRLPWSECPTTTTITMTTTTTAANPRPLNPECQEFQLRPALQSRVLSSPVSTSTVFEKATTSANDAAGVSLATVDETVAASLSREADEVYDISSSQSPTNPEDTSTTIHDGTKQQLVAEQTPSENVSQSVISVGHKPRNRKVEVNGRVDSIENTKAATTSEKLFAEAKSDNVPIDVIDGATLSGRTDTVENGNDSTMADVLQHDLLKDNDNNVNTELLNNHVECRKVEGALTNGEVGFKHLGEPTEQMNVSKSRSVSPQLDDALTDKLCPDPIVSNAKTTTTNINAPEEEETYQSSHHCNNSSVARTTTPSLAQPRKYSKKSSKFVREPTPGPDLDDQAMRSDVENGKVVQQLESVELSYDTRTAYAERDHVADTNDVLDRADRETPQDFGNDDSKTKTTTSQDTIEGSNEDSGFESQTRLPKYPITAAVTEWLRRANSPDTLFLTSASASDSETDEEDDDDEMNAKPPKNLQGNPMPALSANSGVDNSVTTTLSRTASCGEFAKSNNNNNINNISTIDRVETHGTSVIGRRKKDTVSAARRKTAAAKRIDKRNNRKVDDKTQKQSVSSLVSCHRLENVVGAAKLKDPSKSNVGNICEFTQEDSVAGMRVALSSRINSKRVSARRTKTSRRIKRDPVENIDIRMRRIDDAQNGENGDETQDNSVSVRTFEKGEIIVSEDGKLLPTSSYEPVPSDDRDILEMMTKTSTAARAVDMINENMQETCEEETRHNSENDENLMMSSVSIEEPDVLECWEAETIEPVITPKRMLQSPGVLCEGEAVEDDNFEVEKATVEHVRKYYRLDSAISIEEESSEVSTRSMVSVPKSRTVPNNPEKMIERLYGVEEIPIVMPDKSRDIILGDEQIPVDEAFEAYENCYIGGKSPFPTPFNSRMFKQQRPLLQNGEAPIPCRAVCCNIQ
ncbi:uncharacterized protein LOC116854068 isoform X3 [Odontomachus brunneus]|uniref:uncharacterized protein LOC116854068 isoform X3 n=1 Tax=Odontomachus brunneus TaxID=486640 RepID=UPI0013F20BAF|nr:uncharacterized protein LOC116854068 isoform X3 [Odontomachus brunneus]